MSFRFMKKRNCDPPKSAKTPIKCVFSTLEPLEKLVENPRNPNRHPPAQIALLAKVLQHQGWRSPIVVSKRSGFIVSGHGRFAAAKLIGLEQVPVDYQDFASEADEWSHMVADNRLAELAETDDLLLRELLTELQAGGVDSALAGYDEAGLAAVLAGPAEPTAPADFPEVDETLPTEHRCPKCGYQWSGKAA